MRIRTGKTPVLAGIAVFSLVFLSWVGATAVLAEETEPEEKRDPVNWAFASHLGTGIYTASGRTVQVYTIPLSYTYRSIEDNKWGLKVKFPISLGFYDFESKDIVETGLPTDVSTMSILPGVEFEYPIRSNWSLIPFANLGMGRNFSRSGFTYIYSTGIKSLVIFPWKFFEWRFGNQLLYAGYTTPEVDVTESFTTFETGLDMRHPLEFTVRGHPTDFSIYFVNYLYADLELARSLRKSLKVDIQNEFGFTVGTSSEFWWSKNPRIGLGYRFGPQFYAVRIVFGMPF
jgi:hypothetical protein